MKKVLILVLAVTCILVVGCGKEKPNNEVVNDKWPNSDTVKNVPVFIAGTYVSGDCGKTDCQIVFKEVELASFENYAATLINRGFVVNGGRFTKDKKEIYEASNEALVYVKASYDPQTATLTIDSSIKDVK